MEPIVKPVSRPTVAHHHYAVKTVSVSKPKQSALETLQGDESDIRSIISPLALQTTERELAQGPYKEGEIIFRRRGNAEDSPLSFPITVLEEFEFAADGPESVTKSPIVRARIPRGVSTAEAITLLRQDPTVDYAEANMIFSLPENETFTPVADSDFQAHPARTPNDLDKRLWNLHNTGRRNGTAGADIQATSAWEITTGSRKHGPLVAVVDTGIDYKHPELAANMWLNPGEIINDGIDNDNNGVIDDVHGYNAVEDSGDPMDDHSHGSHCAGTIAAVGNNGRGIVGVNWEARMMAIKIFDSRGNTDTATILRGLRYAAKMGVDITNNSWGDSRPSEAIKEGFAAMPSTVHFAAAGNNRNNNDHRNYYPVGHALENMVGVAATDRNDRRPVFSNYGEKTVELAAPGDQILSTVAGGYGVYSGTSMASPHAAGAAALILTEFPQATPVEVRDRLIYNSDPIPALSSSSQSGGRINAAKSLEIDTEGPAPSSRFVVKTANSKGVTLEWVTSGDDSHSGGPPADVELWVSSQPLHLGNLDEAEKLETKKPEENGSVVTYHYPTEHSEKDREFHFAMRFVDNVGQRSDLQTARASLPAAKEFYSTQFGPDDGFQGEEPWARIQEADGNWKWTDSPNGHYRGSEKSSLTSPAISLKGKSQCRLSLSAHYDFWKLDKAVVEASSDGQEWSTLGTYHGRRTSTEERNFDLSEFDGQTVRVRVRMDTDVRYNRDGIYLDSMRILGDEGPA